MSTYSRITDDEMRYFQFKARQRFLVQKEDHEWNEFCKTNRCTCCSCQPNYIPKEMKNIGIQATAKTPIRLNRNTIVKSFQDRSLPESLNDIKTNLEKINLTLAENKFNPLKNSLQKPLVFPSDNKDITSDSTFHSLNGRKREFIRNSLITSLQRLHSFAMQKSPRPLSSTYIKKKNSGFFLPHDLQKQRIIARKAYLASLVNIPKAEIKAKIPTLKNSKKSSKKCNLPNASAKPSNNYKDKKSMSTIEEKEVITQIQSEDLFDPKDENIEKAVDYLLDDLLSEEILSLKKIKQRKIEKQDCNSMEQQLSRAECTNTKANMIKEVHLHTLSPESCDKIKQNPFFNFKIPIKNGMQASVEDNLSDHHDCLVNQEKSNKCPCCEKSKLKNISNNNENLSQSDPSTVKGSKPSASDKYKVLNIDPKMTKAIVRQRNLYWQYLEKISRTRTDRFDPWALSNMVAESLLEDCIVDICQELGDVPTSLIADLYNQEFTQTL